jgi:hypothetical protein
MTVIIDETDEDLELEQEFSKVLVPAADTCDTPSEEICKLWAPLEVQQLPAVEQVECPRSTGILLEFHKYSLLDLSLLRGGSTSGSTTYYLHGWCPRKIDSWSRREGDGVTGPPKPPLTPSS